ncbi:MAG: hypothetical protein ACOVP1_00485 [Bacteroidia bacterium]
MAKIIFKRTQQWANKFRKINIEINGVKHLALADGQEQEIPINGGRIALSANINWTKSPVLELEIGENETKIVQVGCNVEFGLLEKILTGLSLAVLFSSVWYFGEIHLYAWFTLIFLWFIRDLVITKGKSIFYYLSVGRDKYLYLKALNERTNNA